MNATRSKNIAIVVLGCASPPYDRMIDAMRSTWGAMLPPSVDVTYVFGNPDPGDPQAMNALELWLEGETPPRVPDDELFRRDDILIAGCADLFRDQEDSLLRKRLLAFKHLLEDPDVDVIYTVCAASYIDVPELVAATARLRSTDLFYGPISFSADSGRPFISGSSMLLSRDLAERLVADRQRILDENDFGWRDDVTFGHWVATQYCASPPDELPADGFPPEQIFVGATHQTADLVVKPLEEHALRRGVYHYHVHSRRPDAIRNLHHLWLGQGLSGPSPS